MWPGTMTLCAHPHTRHCYRPATTGLCQPLARVVGASLVQQMLQPPLRIRLHVLVAQRAAVCDVRGHGRGTGVGLCVSLQLRSGHDLSTPFTAAELGLVLALHKQVVVQRGYLNDLARARTHTPHTYDGYTLVQAQGDDSHTRAIAPAGMPGIASAWGNLASSACQGQAR